MSMEDQAATCIQARFRAFRWRKLQRRRVRAVSKLQALQRGRFTRREFAALRDFSREQESFQQATRRRQIRIWCNEQELYFLQHTNAADLERVRAFQQQHSARLIQRCWRAVNNSMVASKGDKEEVVAPSDRIYTFDPFGLATPDTKARTDHRRQWSRDNESSEFSPLSPSLFINAKELRASASARKLPAAIAGEEAFASRRKAIQGRIKGKAAQEKVKSRSATKARDTKEGSNPVVNRRRELYEQVVAMKYATAQRVLQYERGSRASRQERELFSAQLVKSCENRIKHLQAESLAQMMPSQEDNKLVHDEAAMMERWDPARRIRAWNHHRRAVCSVLDKRRWWQTQLAGDERDIRQVVVAKSPWEDENKIWLWPRSENSNQKDHDRACSTAIWPSMEIHRFLVGDKNLEEPNNQLFGPVGDDEASEWWRAHCTQSHLAINGALLIEKPYSAEFSNNVTNQRDVFPVCTSEIVANRDLYKLQQRSKRAAQTKSLEQNVQQRIKNLVIRVERQVHEMEVQVEANTQLVLEIEQRKVQRRARITREQQSAMTIQRYARGMRGRKHAREVRAEFFVMVRGRAIRRGRCEECGDQRAVLECQQCEESLHFCPICWVHVHSTRRRKTHVAIPMTTVVSPITVQDIGSTKAPNLNELAAESNKPKIVNVDLNSGPTLRALPSPPKQSTIQSAEPAAVKLKKPTADTELQSSKQDHIRTTTPSRGASTRKNTTPELSEACALVRRVKTEVREAPSTAETIQMVPAKSIPNQPARTMLDDENSRNDELDFSTVEGDGALMNEAENDLDEQKESAESTAQPVTTAISGQPPAVETVSALPGSISVPQGGSNDDEMSEQISNTIESNSEIENGAEAVATTEVAYEQVKRDTKSSTGSVIAGDAVVSANSAVSNDALLDDPPAITESAEQDSDHRSTEEYVATKTKHSGDL
ncbi:hypothetical protein PC121_g3858 [Phytophthora cactorum]|nr:hypothetical protein PC121_g3858 [Phytophthora cactorum]